MVVSFQANICSIKCTILCRVRVIFFCFAIYMENVMEFVLLALQFGNKMKIMAPLSIFSSSGRKIIAKKNMK